MMARLIAISILTLISVSVSAQSPDISSILETHKSELGLKSVDSVEFSVSNAYQTGPLGITHIYLEQRHQDIRVYNGILNLNLAGDKLVSFGNRWIGNLPTTAPDHLPTISALTSVEVAAVHLGKDISDPLETGHEENSLGQVTKVTFEKSTLSEEEITAELIWLQGEGKEVLLCWMVEIHEHGQQNVWRIFIDAHTGMYVKKDNLVVHCNFDHHGHSTHVESHLPARTAQSTEGAGLTRAPMSLAPDSSYNVFAMPVESPNHGSRSMIERPWAHAGPGNPAVTLGWHSNGTTDYTITRGNNVHAYEDIDGSNSNNPGFSPDTSDLRFDYPFDPELHPEDNMAAAITNLFYWNNLIHNVMYQYGFDEPAGNFQVNNLDRGGEDGDDVRAEALDGGGTNNANFFTPVDGNRPRMQMYLWSQVSDGSPLTVNSPEQLLGDIHAVESAFSDNNLLEDIGLTTGDLVLVIDEGDTTHIACGPLSNADSLSGKIAVIDRGDCLFVEKVKLAQDEGAIAAIVINNVAGSPFGMGGSDNTITIPAVMISLNDGNTLKSAMDSVTVNVSLDAVEGIIPDGDYDNGIITHEYGHGISIRLTGGPSQVGCLNNAEQMGEGWSDYFGLMMTTDWTSAEAEDLRGIGTYVLGEPLDGDGIRTYPYATDLDENPFTYTSIENSQGSVHYVGSVWCTILWDMTWKIIEIAGTDPDMYHGTGGNNIALQLVIDALKLQPCSPGFVDGRDAILLADQLRYGGQYSCAIWEAFAGRGLGINASQGSSGSVTDCVESFDTPTGVFIESSMNPSEAGEGQEITVHLRVISGCEGKSDLEIRDILSGDLEYIAGSGGILDSNAVVFTADTLDVLDTLEFSYRAFVRACTASDPNLILEDDAEAPDAFETFKLGGGGTKRWVKDASQFVSAPNSWYAFDYSTYADYVLRLIDPIEITGPVEIAFDHRYETEVTYDGGVVEYSLDGTTWIDAGPYFIENGYPDAIVGNTNSAIAGRDAFTGDSDEQFDLTGFVHSTIRLNIPPSGTFHVRFRMACDGGVGGPGINGWYIDNIEIRQLSGVVNETRVTANNTFLDSLIYAVHTIPFAGEVIYVDTSATGSGNGLTWEDAFGDLPRALEVVGCRTTDSVFIAEGTYLPTLTDDRELSFYFGDSTLVFGGFPVGGSTFDTRDPSSYLTIFSGDIGTPGDHSDNTYHIIQIDTAQHGILLDGITVSHGNANGTGDNKMGSAVFCEGGLTLQNVILSHNTGSSDGLLILVRGSGANLILKDCMIQDTPGSLAKLLNMNGGQIRFEGMMEFVE